VMYLNGFINSTNSFNSGLVGSVIPFSLSPQEII